MYDSGENKEVPEETSDEVSQIQVDSGFLEPGTDSQKQKRHRYHHCALCGEFRQTKFRDRNNNRVCYLCYYNKVVGKQACAICSEVKTVTYRDQNQNRICDKCYRIHLCPKKQCSVCGRKEVVSLYADQGPVCEKCYPKFAPKEKCVGCGEFRRVAARNEQRQPLCDRCYQSGSVKTDAQPPATGGEMLPEHEKNTHDRLIAIVSNIGGEIEEVFNELLETAKQGREAVEQIAATQAALEKVRELVNNHPRVLQTKAPVARVFEKAVEKKTAIKSSQAKKGPELDSDLVLLCKIDLIKAAVQGSEVYEAKRAEVIKVLGLESDKNRSRRVGNMFASTQGKYRNRFFALLLMVMPDSRDNGLLEEMVACYSHIERRVLTIDDVLTKTS
ncbi:hypothetical protein ACFLZY_02030 [Patescibacteria group bacterium]